MKKALTLLLLAAMLTAPLAGCGESAGTDDETAKTTTASTEKDTPASTPAGTDDNIPEYNPDEANPASDFEYEVGEDGGITITKYIGTDTDVVIPEKIEGKSVTRIGENAFLNNNTMVSIVIPNTVIMICQSAFQSCGVLKTADLSDNLTQIEYGAFVNCQSLESIVLPDSLCKLGEEAFSNCSALKAINIPNSVKEWGRGTFMNSGIITVDLEDGLETIGDHAFAYTDLQKIVLPDSIQAIDYMAFAACAQLESVSLNEGLTYIGNSVFGGCKKLEEIMIPSTVIKMNEWALASSSLEKVFFKGNAPDKFINDILRVEDPTFTVYYHEGATGFTSPEWNGYKTEIW
ncbi:MAG: leucine-rich repeat protein [Clostridia bacterium]|nr:leucine-rich repeat protein [Clostridia bacterium]